MKSEMIYMVQFGVAYEGVQSVSVHRTLEGARKAAQKLMEEQYPGSEWKEWHGALPEGSIIQWGSLSYEIDIIEAKIED